MSDDLAAEAAVSPPEPQGEGSGEDAGTGDRSGGRFDSQRAREAARRRWEGRRVAEPDEKIVRALRRKAEDGDVAAARELRAWLDREKEEGREGEQDHLSPAELRRLLDELRGDGQ